MRRIFSTLVILFSLGANLAFACETDGLYARAYCPARWGQQIDGTWAPFPNEAVGVEEFLDWWQYGRSDANPEWQVYRKGCFISDANVPGCRASLRIPRGTVMYRCVEEGVSPGLVDSPYVFRQYHGSGPTGCAAELSRRNTNMACYWSSDPNSAHVRWKIKKCKDGGLNYNIFACNVEDLLSGVPDGILEIDQEMFVFYSPNTKIYDGCNYSVVVRGSGPSAELNAACWNAADGPPIPPVRGPAVTTTAAPRAPGLMGRIGKWLPWTPFGVEAAIDAAGRISENKKKDCLVGPYSDSAAEGLINTGVNWGTLGVGRFDLTPNSRKNNRYDPEKGTWTTNFRGDWLPWTSWREFVDAVDDLPRPPVFNPMPVLPLF